MNISKAWVSICVVISLEAVKANAVNMETVPVGNPGNAGDMRYPDTYDAVYSFGSVAYSYRIGKYEVTAGQYTEFLNAVAATDTYGVYNPSMWTSFYGCQIARSGSPGSYSYSVAADWANRPVNYVSWGDVARFANWMHNGQPTGPQGIDTTEDGSYLLNGANSNSTLITITRQPNATWVIPSEDEWYKAAYHHNDGITGNYWDYPTGTNSVPSNDLSEIDPGNNANFYQGGYTIGDPYYRTEVGAFENSASPYGTFDQGGNVWERNETVIGGSWRDVRGGFFGLNDVNLLASNRGIWGDPADEFNYIGFRLAYVPEPATIMMLALAGMGIIRRRKA